MLASTRYRRSVAVSGSAFESRCIDLLLGVLATGFESLGKVIEHHQLVRPFGRHVDQTLAVECLVEHPLLCRRVSGKRRWRSRLGFGPCGEFEGLLQQMELSTVERFDQTGGYKTLERGHHLTFIEPGGTSDIGKVCGTENQRCHHSAARLLGQQTDQTSRAEFRVGLHPASMTPTATIGAVILLPWRETLRRLGPLLVGLYLFGAGIAFMVEADLGLGPWDVFHQGAAELTGLSIGRVINIVGFMVVLAFIPLRERLGLGTILNALVIGWSADATAALLPELTGLPIRAGAMLAGPVLIAIGSGFYIGAGLGPGPRDGVMTGLARRGHRRVEGAPGNRGRCAGRRLASRRIGRPGNNLVSGFDRADGAVLPNPTLDRPPHTNRDAPGRRRNLNNAVARAGRGGATDRGIGGCGCLLRLDRT